MLATAQNSDRNAKRLYYYTASQICGVWGPTNFKTTLATVPLNVVTHRFPQTVVS
jgi:hypothetical protein